MKKLRHIILLSLGLVAAVACNSIYENGEEMAATLKPAIKELNVAELKSKIEKGEDFLLLDVRQKNEFEIAAIPGAVNIPRGLLEFKIRDEQFWEEEFLYVPEDKAEIVVYCKEGFRGILAAHALQQLGFSNVRSLTGGYKSWDPNMSDSNTKKASGGGCGG
jgi:rhodanese-related sulfurtransferase